MKHLNKRILPFLLALILVFQLTPVAFATASDASEEDVVAEEIEQLSQEETSAPVDPEPSETPEETEAPAPAQTEAAEEPAETSAAEEVKDTPTEETVPAEETEPEETAEAEVTEPGSIPVTFVFDQEYLLQVKQGDAEMTAQPGGEEFTAVYLLAPGMYTYTAETRGHDVLTDSFELTEDMDGLRITPDLNAYPYSLAGLPLEYKLDSKAMALKQDAVENKVVETLSELTAGKDYEADTVYFLAPDHETAEMYAESLNASLVSYENTVAVVRLNGATVPQVVAASCDESLRLPFVSPNYIVKLNDPVQDPVNGKTSLFGVVSGSVSWRTWYDSVSQRDTYLRNPSSESYQYMHDVVSSYKAWGITTGNPSVTVAVVDTGIDTDHPDLGNLISTGYYSEYGTVEDGNGHGTHCAGIIAAKQNGIGGSGIAPDVRLLAYKALSDQGGGENAAVTSGIIWATNQGADVISLSLGSLWYDGYERLVVENAVNQGCTVVVAMGNNGTNTACYPAAYPIPGMITVGATDRANVRAPYSNSGKWMDVSAPGSDIMSAAPGGGYQFMSGTSMATPVVAGVTALYISAARNRGIGYVAPVNVEKAIKASTTKGIVDAYKAITKANTIKIAAVGVSTKKLDDVTTEYPEGSQIPMDYVLQLTSVGEGDADRIIYTTDGTYPGCYNGAVSNGQVYDGGIDLSGFKAGDIVTLTARCITDAGDMGEPTQFSFLVGQAAAANTEETKPVETQPEAAPEATTSESAPEITVTEDASPASNNSLSNLTGSSVAAIGKKVTYTVTKAVKTLKVTWSVSDKSGYNVSSGNVSISSTGVLTVKASASTGYVTVKATASDGSYLTKTVKIDYPPDRMDLHVCSPSIGSKDPVYNAKTGALSTAYLYSTDSPAANISGKNTLIVGLYSGASSVDTEGAYSVTSSNTKILTITPSGSDQFTITAKPGMAGTATIKVTALDGTKKAASFKVIVSNPVSRIALTSSIKSSTGLYALAVGKSATHKTVFAETYGKPTNKKVTWDAEMKIINRSTGNVVGIGYIDGYATLSKTGTLKVLPAAAFLIQSSAYYYQIDVWATATDGTAQKSDVISYVITDPITKITSYKKIIVARDSGYRIDFSFDSGRGGYRYLDCVTVSSSKPEVASVSLDEEYYRKFVLTTGQKPGTATVTIKANDGTNKTWKITVVVK